MGNYCHYLYSGWLLCENILHVKCFFFPLAFILLCQANSYLSHVVFLQVPAEHGHVPELDNAINV